MARRSAEEIAYIRARNTIGVHLMSTNWPEWYAWGQDRRRAMIEKFVRTTPDKELLRLRNFGEASLGRLRRECPYEGPTEGPHTSDRALIRDDPA